MCVRRCLQAVRRSSSCFGGASFLVLLDAVPDDAVLGEPLLPPQLPINNAAEPSVLDYELQRQGEALSAGEAGLCQSKHQFLPSDRFGWRCCEQSLAQLFTQTAPAVERCTSLHGDVVLLVVGVGVVQRLCCVVRGPRGRWGQAGARQLVSVARVVVRRPRVVCLDEATAHVQGPAGFLTHLMADQHVTVLMIAHRLPSLRGCGRTAVLAGGRLVEHGGTEQLLSDPGSLLTRMSRDST